MSIYDIIFEALQYKVLTGELTLEYAEMVNDLAYNIYIVEDGHSKKLKARHNAKKKNNEKRFYDNMGYKHEYTDKRGNKCGTATRDDGPTVKMIIGKKHETAYYPSHDVIYINKNITKLNGSDLVGSHEYSHARDRNEFKKELSKQYKDHNSELYKIRNELSKATGDDIKKFLKKKEEITDNIKKDIKGSNGFNELTKEVTKKYNLVREHDKDPSERKADYYAITSTKGDNNSNRIYKILNEISRRHYSNYERQVHEMEKNQENGISKSDIDAFYDEISKKKNDTKKSDKKCKNANDYILQKKQNENK